jgi:prepilin-type processing-associated H-X9-DG protein
MSGGYGYNYRYLAPITPAQTPPFAPGLPAGTETWTKIRVEQVGSTSQTIFYVTAAWAVPNSPLTPGQAGLIETGLAEPPSRQFPSVHFRTKPQLAHVVFVDGHAEMRSDPTRNPPPAGEPAAVAQVRDAQNLFDLGTDDTLWDRE